MLILCFVEAVLSYAPMSQFQPYFSKRIFKYLFQFGLNEQYFGTHEHLLITLEKSVQYKGEF